MEAPFNVLTNAELPVAVLDAAIRWYAEKLGAVEQWQRGGRAFVALPGEGVRLFLVETKDPARLGFVGSDGSLQHGGLDFYAADLAAAHGLLSARGVDLDPLTPGAMGFGFRDLDGNRFGVHSDRESYEHRKRTPIP